MWVEVGYDLEQWVTDGFAGETSREVMTPFFRNGQYGAGLRAGAERIIGRIAQGRNVTLDGVRVAAPDRAAQHAPRSPSWLPIVIFIVILIVSRLGGGGGRRSGFWARRRLVERRRPVRRRLRRRVRRRVRRRRWRWRLRRRIRRIRRRPQRRRRRRLQLVGYTYEDDAQNV